MRVDSSCVGEAYDVWNYCVTVDFFENYCNTVTTFLYKYCHHSISYQKLYNTLTVRWLKYWIQTIFYSNYRNTVHKVCRYPIPLYRTPPTSCVLEKVKISSIFHLDDIPWASCPSHTVACSLCLLCYLSRTFSLFHLNNQKHFCLWYYFIFHYLFWFRPGRWKKITKVFLFFWWLV